jgi:D-3-phosphoglycerate dehydrogenase
MKLQLLIAESRGFAPAALRLLQERFDVVAADLDRAGLRSRLAPFDALWVRVRTRIDAELMDAAPKLKWVATNTTGLTHIDLDAARRRGIAVVSLKDETEFLRTIRATAELTLGLTLALIRRIPWAHGHAAGGAWDRSQFPGTEIYEKTVGIIGYGRLGRIVAHYFQAFGADVVVHDRVLGTGTVVDGFRTVSLEELLSVSDIASLHVNYEPANRHLLGAEQFEKMKPTAVFVNTARGELVDEQALADAIRHGSLAGAAVDVLEDEHSPERGRRGLLDLAQSSERVVLTPHIGGHTVESTAKTELFLAGKLNDLIARRLARRATAHQPSDRSHG